MSPRAITAALDMRALYGPEVDRACGVEEPAVDEWQAGQRYPSWEQLEALARLTEFLVEFFTRPHGSEISGGFMWLRSGRRRGCHPLGAPRGPGQSPREVGPNPRSPLTCHDLVLTSPNDTSPTVRPGQRDVSSVLVEQVVSL